MKMKKYYENFFFIFNGHSHIINFIQIYVSASHIFFYLAHIQPSINASHKY